MPWYRASNPTATAKFAGGRELHFQGRAVHDPLRPTFERQVPGVAPEALAERIAGVLSEAERGLPHRRAGQHFMVWIPATHRRTWSPWLHLDVNEAEGGAALFGRFTPAPSLWTGVMLTYLALALLSLGGALFAYSQWLVGETPSGLWLTLGALIVGLLLLASSRAGQALARGQMGALTGVLERAVTGAEPVPIGPRPHGPAARGDDRDPGPRRT